MTSLTDSIAVLVLIVSSFPRNCSSSYHDTSVNFSLVAFSIRLTGSFYPSPLPIFAHWSDVLISSVERSLVKMSRAQAESVIKNIIREIAQECANKGQAVSETLVAFMVGRFSWTKI